jgi:hypothetical protein
MNLTNTVESSEKNDCKSVYAKKNVSATCISCSVEKLLANMSNKLGLSLAIYLK